MFAYESILPPEVISLLAPLVTVYIVLVVYAIASYVMTSLSLFTIAKRRGVSAYGLAWVPAANAWVLGGIADKHDAQQERDHKWRKILLILSIAVLIGIVVFVLIYIEELTTSIYMAQAMFADEAAMIAYFTDMFWTVFAAALPMSLASGALAACEYICLYKLFVSCKPQKPVKSLLIYLIVPFAAPFVLLSCRKRDHWIIRSDEPTDPPMIAEEAQ